MHNKFLINSCLACFHFSFLCDIVIALTCMSITLYGLCFEVLQNIAIFQLCEGVSKNPDLKDLSVIISIFNCGAVMV